MSWQEYSLGLIDALALPGVVLILGILFFRPLRAVSRRVQDDLAAGKALHIGAGGVHVGITERDDYHAQWYKPYQLKTGHDRTRHSRDNGGAARTRPCRRRATARRRCGAAIRAGHARSDAAGRPPISEPPRAARPDDAGPRHDPTRLVVLCRTTRV